MSALATRPVAIADNRDGGPSQAPIANVPKLPREYRSYRVSVVIPALNEAPNIPHVMKRIPEWVYEVILVDGHSTDDTTGVAQEVWPNHHIVAQERRAGRDRRNRARLVAQERRGDGMSLRLVLQSGRGKGNALQAGIAAATGDIVVLIDADGSTPPEEIGRFADTLIDGADFAKGSRFLRGGGTDDMPVYRQIGNWGLVIATNVLFGTRYTDITYGYNALWRKHADALANEIDGWANEIISNIRVARHGLKVVEVPSFEEPRIAGEAKLQGVFRIGWRILRAIIAERCSLRPSRRAPAMPLDHEGVMTIVGREPRAVTNLTSERLEVSA